LSAPFPRGLRAPIAFPVNRRACAEEAAASFGYRFSEKIKLNQKPRSAMVIELDPIALRFLFPPISSCARKWRLSVEYILHPALRPRIAFGALSLFTTTKLAQFALYGTACFVTR